MSWIALTVPEQAPADVKQIFDRIRARSSRGQVSHVWQALGADPAALSAAFEQYTALMDDPAPLTAAQVQMLALVVSATNGCGYCVAHAGPRLASLAGDELARAVARDYREANLTARDRVLLDAAVALTCEPCERKAEDLERLREYGFDERALLKATAIAALYNFMNRVVCAFGLPLEAGLEPWEFGAQR